MSATILVPIKFLPKNRVPSKKELEIPGWEFLGMGFTKTNMDQFLRYEMEDD